MHRPLSDLAFPAGQPARRPIIIPHIGLCPVHTCKRKANSPHYKRRHDNPGPANCCGAQREAHDSQARNCLLLSSNRRRALVFLVFFIFLFYTLRHLVLQQPSHPLRDESLPPDPMAMASKYPPGHKRCIVYHTDWANYARNFQVTNLATFMNGITDIAYAFFNIQDSGGGNYVIVAGDT